MAAVAEITPERDLPSVAYLRERLTADPETGSLTWNYYAGARGCWNARWAGRPAFTADNGAGYRQGRVDGVTLKAHRVLWALVYGAWPTGELDHINGDTADNRIANLREVDRGANCRNVKRRKDNTTGRVGVWASPSGRRWHAAIVAQKQRVFLGSFASFNDAAAARDLAEREYGFHENHGREG